MNNIKFIVAVCFLYSLICSFFFIVTDRMLRLFYSGLFEYQASLAKHLSILFSVNQGSDLLIKKQIKLDKNLKNKNILECQNLCSF